MSGPTAMDLTDYLQQHGVKATKNGIAGTLAEVFQELYRGRLTITAMLLNDTECARFCGRVRHRFGVAAPDNLILDEMKRLA